MSQAGSEGGMTSLTARLWTTLGGGLVILGAFLPWAAAGIEVSGIQGDGFIALGLGIAIIAFTIAAFQGDSRTPEQAVVVFGAAAWGLYVWECLVIVAAASEVGAGLLVGGAGALVAIFASNWMSAHSRRASTRALGE
jgi:hypothetical protein